LFYRQCGFVHTGLNVSLSSIGCHSGAVQYSHACQYVSSCQFFLSVIYFAVTSRDWHCHHCVASSCAVEQQKVPSPEHTWSIVYILYYCQC